jgi:glycosyltransferase involved in cell wall biosynthesis
VTDQPPISVVIPAFNAAGTLVRALESIRAQNWPDIEVVVVDDGSKDDTIAVAAAYQGLRVRVIDQGRNRGVFPTINRGIQEAQHNLVAFLDSDDEWMPDKLARQVPALLADRQAIFSATGSLWIDPEGTVVKVLGCEPSPHNPSEFWRMQFANTTVSGITVLAWRDRINRLGGFDETLRNGSDQDMWIRLAFCGSVVFLPEPLARVYVSAGSVTSRLKDENFRLEKRVYSRYIPEVRRRLGPRDAAKLIARRMSGVGKNLCWSGFWREGAPDVLRAIFLGVNVRSNLWLLLTTAPGVRNLRRLVRG